MHKGILTLIFACMAVLIRSSLYISSPLWLDYFKTNHSSNNHENKSVHYYGNSAQFLMIGNRTFAFVFYSVWIVLILIFMPSKIGGFERNFPKSHFVKIGISTGVSSVLFNYSLSGSRTPLYLQGILANCHIPIQFTTRFILLRKKPTAIKITCAVVIILAELLCLIPTIFPSLEPNSAKLDDGGASGVGRILWPMCMVSSMIPFAIANTLTERSVQKEGKTDPTADISKLNLIYFQFWWSLFVLLTVTGFFWTDIIPGFGTSGSWHEFTEKFRFDFLCLFGQAGCPSTVIILGWLNFLLNVLAGFSLPALMRYSEGANFVVIVLTLRTPVVFVFWSLFDEQPFHWHPHAHLGTWLSIGAICIMLPAVVCYDMGDKWLAHFRRKYRYNDFTIQDDCQERLVNSDIQGYVNNSTDGDNEPLNKKRS